VSSSAFALIVTIAENAIAMAITAQKNVMSLKFFIFVPPIYIFSFRPKGKTIIAKLFFRFNADIERID